MRQNLKLGQEVSLDGWLSIARGLIICPIKLILIKLLQNAVKTLKNQGKPPISLLSKQDQEGAACRACPFLVINWSNVSKNFMQSVRYSWPGVYPKIQEMTSFVIYRYCWQKINPYFLCIFKRFSHFNLLSKITSSAVSFQDFSISFISKDSPSNSDWGRCDPKWILLEL